MKIFITLVLLLTVGCATATTPNASSLVSSSSQNDQQITSSSVASSSVSSTPASSSSSSALLELTLAELKQFDGKGGRKAYIAVGGTIYDVTGNLNWFRGNHNGFEAGQDLTAAMDNESPHGRSKLVGLPIVGKIKS
jgi:predicted heme/steroid binding protein